MREGTVDLYFDSPFPTLAVQDVSGSEVILRRWKGGTPTYWSTFVALRDNRITSAEDLLGKVVAFVEPHSTSGFVLPAGSLIQSGYSLTDVGGTEAHVGPNEIGYYFSGHEQNTFELLWRGRVAAGGVSDKDYEKLPPELKEQTVAFGRTIEVPRQLVSVRPGLGPALVDRVRELLVGLDKTEEGRKLLDHLKQTKKFDPLTPESQDALADFRTLMDLT